MTKIVIRSRPHRTPEHTSTHSCHPLVIIIIPKSIDLIFTIPSLNTHCILCTGKHGSSIIAEGTQSPCCSPQWGARNRVPPLTQSLLPRLYEIVCSSTWHKSSLHAHTLLRRSPGSTCTLEEETPFFFFSRRSYSAWSVWEIYSSHNNCAAMAHTTLHMTVRTALAPYCHSGAYR